MPLGQEIHTPLGYASKIEHTNLTKSGSRPLSAPCLQKMLEKDIFVCYIINALGSCAICFDVNKKTTSRDATSSKSRNSPKGTSLRAKVGPIG